MPVPPTIPKRANNVFSGALSKMHVQRINSAPAINWHCNFFITIGMCVFHEEILANLDSMRDRDVGTKYERFEYESEYRFSAVFKPQS